MTKRTTPSTRTSKWLSYSGMATAFLAVGQDADGQVVYTDVDPDSVLNNATFDVDFDGDGTVDVGLFHAAVNSSSSNFAGVGAQVPAGNAVIGTVTGGYMYPSVLANGDPIAPGAPNFQTASNGTLFLVYSGSNSYGNWNGQTGFLGCRFVAGGGGTHYGWVELAVANGAATATVIAYGYQATPDSSILAGDPGPLGIAAVAGSTLNLGVAPNPAQGLTTVTFTTAEASEVQVGVVNAMGQLLMAERHNAVAGANTLSLDVTSLAAGSYFVRLQVGDQVAFRKVDKVN